MKLRQPEIEIIHDNPFVNCKLNRGQYAEVLTKIIENQEEGFVLAINNEWGTGKTTFVRMWQKRLENSGFKTIYFNAWENDFESNPLIALISEFKRISDSKTNKTFETVMEKALPIAKKVVPSILKAITEKYIGKDFTQQIANEIIDGTSDLFEKEIDNHIEKKKSIEVFKVSLSEFVNESSPDKPLVFFIDELDRCRPTYAVNLLEQVKHIFSINNIVFVLSIDKIQLGNAIRGFYGSENINAEEYLRRFIELEYSIPEPDSEAFCKYLYSCLRFDDFFNSPLRSQFGTFQQDPNTFLQFTVLLFNSLKIQLRVQEKIMTHCRVALNLFKKESIVLPDVLLFLIFLKFLHKDVYKQIQLKTYTIQQIINGIERVLKNKYSEQDVDRLIFMEVFLTLVYANTIEKVTINNFIEFTEEGTLSKLLINTDLDNSKNKRNFVYYTQLFFEPRHRLTKLNIDYFINKIELTESFKK